MRTFKFESISLLSRREQAGLVVTFDSGKNLILGQNHTGKSSLIRALYETLGASPQGTLEEWDENMISVVSFRVDTESYRAIRKCKNRAIFNEDGDLLVATNDHQVWSDAFANLTGFNLVLGDEGDVAVPADPSCFFLPFYINQDGSWQSSWNTFRRVHHYRSYQASILEYFCGIRPPEYYSLRAEKDLRSRDLEELRRDCASLERALQRFNRTLPLAGLKIVPDHFEREIAKLTEEATNLNAQQEVMREKIVRERELYDSLQRQIHLAAAALTAYDSDMKFLLNGRGRLICPVCTAEHTDPFYDLLTYAEDARVLRELVVRLRQDAEAVQRRCCRTQAKLDDLVASYGRISRILNTRRGDMVFRDVVDSLGAESAFAAFADEEQHIKRNISDLAGQVGLLDLDMSRLNHPKRAKEIRKRFRSYYAEARQALRLRPVNTEHIGLTSRPDSSGSGGPRAILAYYSAIWNVCHDGYGAFSVPLVIDSPNQQGQDDINLPAMLQFIANGLPHSAQLIVGSEHSTQCHFDKTIRIDIPHRLLRQSEHSSVRSTVDPLEQTMVDHLLRQNPGTLFSE